MTDHDGTGHGRGDGSAAAVARQLAITEIEAETPPERKRDIIRRLRAEGRIVAMAGDGINDAPAEPGGDVQYPPEFVFRLRL